MAIKGTGRVGKWISDKMWQVGQIKDIVAIPFMATTTTGVYYPIILTWCVENGINLPGSVIFWSIMAISFIFFVFLGIIYDINLKFWKHRRTTDIERNQYNNDTLMPIQRKFWKNYLLGMEAMQEIARKLDAVEAQKKLEEQVIMTKNWIKTGEVP